MAVDAPGFLQTWSETWTAPDPGPLTELYAKDCVYVDVGTGARAEGRDGLVRFADFMRRFAPDSTIVFHDLIRDGARYASRWTWSGSAVGPIVLEGRVLAPTGQPFSVDGVAIGEVDEDGLIATHTDIYDMRATLRDCGVDEAAADPRAERLVRGFYAALAAGDGKAVRAALADDFTSHLAEGMPAGGGAHDGPDAAIADGWWAIGRAYDVAVEIEEIAGVSDGRVLVAGRYRGAARDGSADVDASLLHLWTVRDGRLAALQQVTDTARWG